MFLSLDLLSEYRIQHGAIGPLYVTSDHLTGIFCRGVSGFATNCPCDVWCRGLTTCLLHFCAPFGNRFLNTSWAVGLTYWIVYLHFFCILTYAIIYVLIHHIMFWLYLYFLNILYQCLCRVIECVITNICLNISVQYIQWIPSICLQSILMVIFNKLAVWISLSASPIFLITFLKRYSTHLEIKMSSCFLKYLGYSQRHS